MITPGVKKLRNSATTFRAAVAGIVELSSKLRQMFTILTRKRPKAYEDFRGIR